MSRHRTQLRLIDIQILEALQDSQAQPPETRSSAPTRPGPDDRNAREEPDPTQRSSRSSAVAGLARSS